MPQMPTIALKVASIFVLVLAVCPGVAQAELEGNRQIQMPSRILEVASEPIETELLQMDLKSHDPVSVSPLPTELEPLTDLTPTEMIQMELTGSSPVDLGLVEGDPVEEGAGSSTPQRPSGGCGGSIPVTPIDVEIVPLELTSTPPASSAFETGDIPTQQADPGRANGSDSDTDIASGSDSDADADDRTVHEDPSQPASSGDASHPDDPAPDGEPADTPTHATEPVDKTQGLTSEEIARRREEARLQRARVEYRARQDMGRDPVPIGGQLYKTEADPALLSGQVYHLGQSAEAQKGGQTRERGKNPTPIGDTEPDLIGGIAPITGSTVMMATTTGPCPTGEKIDIHLVDKDVYTPFLYPGSTPYTDMADIVSILTALVGANYDPTGRCGKCMRNINIWGHGSVGGGYIAFGPVDGVAGNSQGAADLSAATASGLESIKSLMCDDGHIYLNMCEAGKGVGGDNALQRVADLVGVPVSAPEGSISGCRIFGGALTSYKTKLPPRPPPPPPSTTGGASSGIAPVTGSSQTR